MIPYACCVCCFRLRFIDCRLVDLPLLLSPSFVPHKAVQKKKVRPRARSTRCVASVRLGSRLQVRSHCTVLTTVKCVESASVLTTRLPILHCWAPSNARGYRYVGYLVAYDVAYRYTCTRYEYDVRCTDFGGERRD
eukprot:scaffold68080_cov51-Attheya_sp.AAC.7